MIFDFFVCLFSVAGLGSSCVGQGQLELGQEHGKAGLFFLLLFGGETICLLDIFFSVAAHGSSNLRQGAEIAHFLMALGW